MILTFSNGSYFFNAPANMVEAKKAGFIYLKSSNRWYTQKADRALKLLEYADEPTRQRLRGWADSRYKAIEGSIKTESDLQVPAPEGLSYRPYQLAGAEFMLARHSSLNADVPRLGKTIQTMALINSYQRPLKTLVVCPAIAKANWVREAQKWAVIPVEAAYCEGAKNPKTPFLVCNYEILKKHATYLLSTEWDIVVIDEAHYIGNPKSDRTKYVKRLKAKLHKLFLSGTPAFTRPKNLFPMLQQLDPSGLGRNFFSFGMRYCAGKKTHFGFDFDGASHQNELQFEMRSKFMVRREKADVMEEIPPQRSTVYLSKAGLTKLIDQELNIVQQRYKSILEALTPGADPVALETLARFDGRVEDDSEPIATVRKKLAIAKIDMIVDFCEDLLATEPKVVIFCHHRDVTLQVAERLKMPAIVGGMSTAQKDLAVNWFKSDPMCRGIVGNITAMSTAISLKEADIAVFAELSWVPAEIDQAEERIWDVEKTVPCQIIKLVVEDSLEARIANVVTERQKQMQRLMNKRHVTLA